MRIVDKAKAWARKIKQDAVTLWFAARSSDTPWYAKALALFTVGYALSPIDLIPDFIPVLGLLDDVIILPVLIWLTVRLLPPAVLADSRTKAQEWLAGGKGKPRSKVGAAVIVLLWVSAVFFVGMWLWPNG
jgi:uncharacterized membrane protein YkvA (DUF1232 family)